MDYACPLPKLIEMHTIYHNERTSATLLYILRRQCFVKQHYHTFQLIYVICTSIFSMKDKMGRSHSNMKTTPLFLKLVKEFKYHHNVSSNDICYKDRVKIGRKGIGCRVNSYGICIFAYNWTLYFSA